MEGSVTPATTYFGCTVKAFISETYGKMPDSQAKDQIIMEYEYYMDIFAKSTSFDPNFIAQETSEQFTAWMLTEPNLSYYFAN